VAEKFVGHFCRPLTRDHPEETAADQIAAAWAWARVSDLFSYRSAYWLLKVQIYTKTMAVLLGIIADTEGSFQQHINLFAVAVRTVIQLADQYVYFGDFRGNLG
jgi:hypothetical protein